MPAPRLPAPSLALAAAAALALALAAGCGSGRCGCKRDAAPAPAADAPRLAWPEVEAALAEGAVLVDARGPAAYAAGHVVGAINVPARDAAAVSRLPRDKATPLVFYGEGEGEPSARAGASRAAAAGYRDVRVHEGGYGEWKDLRAPSSRRQARIEASVPRLAWPAVEAALARGAVLVDARSEAAFAAGHVEGALSVPFADARAYERLPADRATPLVFYCQGPGCVEDVRGALAAQNLGFLDVAVLEGGYEAWPRAKP